MSKLRLLAMSTAILSFPTYVLGDTLLEILNRKETAFGVVRFESGKEAESSLVFYEKDKLAYYSIYGKNIVCMGSMKLLASSENYIEYSIDATAEGYSECPTDGSMTIGGPSDDARIDLSIFSASGTIKGSLEISGLYEEQLAQNGSVTISSNPSPSACENHDWNSPIRNFPDMMLCDEGRAIQEMYGGKLINFKVDSVQFKNNYLYAIMRQTDSWAMYMLSPEMINTIDFGEALRIKTNARVVQAQCAFKMPVSKTIRQGDELVVIGKLAKYEKTYQGEFVLMSCSLQ